MLLQFLAVSWQQVLGWGNDGHSIVAEIAERLLSDRTKQRALHLVNNSSLSAIADWADEYRHTPEGHWSGNLHFADLPDRVCVFEPARDCLSSRCVYGAIMNYTHRLQAVGAPEDLKFLVHLVGDAHQPLHAGFTSDRGGNEIHVVPEFHRKHSDEPGQTVAESTQEMNLHAVWDEVILLESEQELQSDLRPNHHLWMKKADRLFSGIDASLREKTERECNSGFECALVILKETAHLACDKAYQTESNEWIKSGDHLDRKYYESRIATVDLQLKRAGIRLAVLLEKALGDGKYITLKSEVFDA